ncbi:hypothetical protein F5Y13DRAFT_200321 [Hypoxylon sp. FL1857]|nr:hypothetical protein F5Y13DRAFT_200321 [Hypoxylon sp. FL1857]
MDALAALGLVGNIITFVDFSWKLVAGARQIYESASEISDNGQSLEVIATSIIELSNAIVTNYAIPDDLRKLSTECHKVAEDLLEVISQLKRKGKHRRWESFVAALKEVWKHGEIDGLVERLQRLQSQLVVQIQFTMLDQQSSVARALADIDETNKKFYMEQSQTLVALRHVILSELQDLKIDYSQQALETSRKQIKELQRVDQDMISELSKRLQSLSVSMIQLEGQCKTTTADQKFLRSLYFQRFMSRHDKIEAAHAQTFEWVFQDSQDSHEHTASPGRFAEWLRSKHGLFWIQGKAGSGKSTLMKFLWHHHSTTHLLHHWAGEDKLVVASYFFWAAGNELQKSQEGLLRTLLFEILRNCPEIISQVRGATSQADDWASSFGQEAWSFSSLKTMYHLSMKQHLSAKFCFLIDGLDEYKGNNTLELIELIKSFTKYSHIKICTSSRPWAEFKHAFGCGAAWHLKLEDLTAADIRQYVRDRLNENEQFKDLTQDDASYEDLANEVVKRAQGVFLWVYLVVRSLLEGAQHADSIDEMRHRLERFPEGLEDFFKQMLEDIPSFYRRKSAQTFKIALAAAEPLPLVIYAFVEDVSKQDDFALTASIGRLSENELEERMKHIPYRLDARCKGLLEIVRGRDVNSLYDEYEVDFLHRTVRDFLHGSRDVHDMFQQALDDEFSPSLILCNAFLADLKLSWITWSPAGVSGVSSLYTVKRLLSYAQQAQGELHDNSKLYPILDETERVLLAPGSRYPYKDHGVAAFLGQATESALCDYVNRRLSNEPLCRNSKTGSILSSTGRPLLDYALQSIPVDPKMVQCLLEHGTNPNQKRGYETVWSDFLSNICARDSNYARQDSTRSTVGLLIKHGADLKKRVHIAYDTEMEEFQRKPSVTPLGGQFIKARDVIAVLYPDSKGSLLAQAPSPFNFWDRLRQRVS